MFLLVGYVIILAASVGTYSGSRQPGRLVGAARVSGDRRTDDRWVRGRKRHQGDQGHHRRPPGIFKGSKYSKAAYVDLLAMLFEVLAKVRKEGLMSIENDAENPHESPILGSILRSRMIIT